MNPYLIVADLVAIIILVVAFYLPRRGRRELVSSFLVTNIGVLAVATAMSAGTIAAGLGLGLFGVLSIIRLRSEEISHREIAYYFASLSLGLLGGLSSLPLLWSIGLMALVLLAIAVGDHPRITARSKSAKLIIDEAITDPEALKLRASELLGATVTDLVIDRIDLINDSTAIRVRFNTHDRQSRPFAAEPRRDRQGTSEPSMRTLSQNQPSR